MCCACFYLLLKYRFVASSHLLFYFFVDTTDLYVNFQGSLCPVGGNSWRPHWLEKVFTFVKFLTFVFGNFSAVLFLGTMAFFTNDHLQWWHFWADFLRFHFTTIAILNLAVFELNLKTHCHFPLAFNLFFMIFTILLLIRPLLSSENFTFFIWSLYIAARQCQTLTLLF